MGEMEESREGIQSAESRGEYLRVQGKIGEGM